MKKSYANASILKNGRVVFNIKENDYRLVARLNYEKKHYPIEAPDPIEAIKIRMEELGLRQVDLVGEIGGKSRVSEIINKKRKLTIENIRKLSQRLNLYQVCHSYSDFWKPYNCLPKETHPHGGEGNRAGQSYRTAQQHH